MPSDFKKPHDEGIRGGTSFQWSKMSTVSILEIVSLGMKMMNFIFPADINSVSLLTLQFPFN